MAQKYLILLSGLFIGLVVSVPVSEASVKLFN